MSLDADVRREFPLSLKDFRRLDSVRVLFKVEYFGDVVLDYKRCLIIVRGMFPKKTTSEVRDLSYQRLERVYELKQIKTKMRGD